MLIVGAGPTGLVLALWLSRLQVRVRIVDKTLEPGTTSRALAVQARTLEFYQQLGLADAVVRRARAAVAVNLWVAGRQVAHVCFGDLGATLSAFPNPLIFPQDEHERLLIERLGARGVTVERGTELVDFVESDERIRARLRRSDGVMESCAAAYMAGCDGAHSTVREQLGIGFPGGTYDHLFYVADVQAAGTAANGELHVGLDAADFVAVFPLRSPGGVRLVGAMRDAPHQQHDQLAWADVGQRVIQWMHLDVRQVNWFSTYRVHHRVASQFHAGRAFLLGDAAHIHSPVGGQGMNTGIGDAVNLAWKLAAVLGGRAAAAILDTYEAERIGFARRLVATTDRAFSGVTNRGVGARWLRLRVVPVLMPLLFAFRGVRRFLFRTVSQTSVNYRGSALSEGRCGAVHGGDRLPWAMADESDSAAGNFSALASLDWQVHVYGAASSALRSVCAARQLPLHVFSWRPQLRRAGLCRDVGYLVRPDGYVALVDSRGGVALSSYMEKHGILTRPA
ncbi:MAG TPA: FAD-dependent monooxygenase [Steroidobacteraceae bacterium]